MPVEDTSLLQEVAKTTISITTSTSTPSVREIESVPMSASPYVHNSSVLGVILI